MSGVLAAAGAVSTFIQVIQWIDQFAAVATDEAQFGAAVLAVWKEGRAPTDSEWALADQSADAAHQAEQAAQEQPAEQPPAPEPAAPAPQPAPAPEPATGAPIASQEAAGATPGSFVLDRDRLAGATMHGQASPQVPNTRAPLAGR